MTAATTSSLGARVLAAVTALVMAGCAAIVGADFDVSARPEPVPDGGIAGPRVTPSFRVQAPDGQSRLLGLSVAVEGDTALIGARDDYWIGRVFVAKRGAAGSWDIAQKLDAGPFAAPNSQFGSSVAISGDWAIIGARGADRPVRRGAAYFFHRTGGVWAVAPEQEVTAPVPDDGDEFGTRVAIEDSIAVVGAPGSVPGTGGGAAYVYALGPDGLWTLVDPPLRADDGEADNRFGTELALRGDTLVVGAPLSDASGPDSGAAYVFDHAGGAWNAGQKILPGPGDATGVHFGDGTIGLEEGLLIVPAIFAPSAEQFAAFNRGASGTWVREVLAPPPGLVSQSAGRAAVRGDAAVLSVSVSPDAGMGLVYRRKGGAWRYEERLESGSDSKDVFGWTIAFDGRTACFGAIFFRDQEGAAYFFNL